MEYFDSSSLRLRVYIGRINKPNTEWFQGKQIYYYYNSDKIKNPAYQIYVNSKPLLRCFQNHVNNRKKLSDNLLSSFFSGRFDGDGCVSEDGRSNLRIVYSNFLEAKIDKHLLAKMGINKTNIYHHKKANTFALYIYRSQAKMFVKLIENHSLKLKKLLIAP